MLDSERRDQGNCRYNELVFYNNSPEVFSASTKRNHNTSNTTKSPESNSPSTFNENDNVLIGGSQISLGTQVGRLSRSMTITDRKARYFLTLGNNGILYISDTSTRSQMSTFTQTVKDLIKQRFPKLTFASNNSITSQIEGQQSRITEYGFLKSLDRFYSILRYNKTFLSSLTVLILDSISFIISICPNYHKRD